MRWLRNDCWSDSFWFGRVDVPRRYHAVYLLVPYLWGARRSRNGDGGSDLFGISIHFFRRNKNRKGINPIYIVLSYSKLTNHIQ